MKENSIEKDIHLLESYAGMTHKMNDNQGRPKLDQAIEHILQDYKRVLKENEEFRNFLEKIIREYISDYELEQLIDRYKNESFIPRVEVKKILEDRRK